VINHQGFVLPSPHSSSIQSASSSLTKLDISANYRLGPKAGMALAAALKTGRLKELDALLLPYCHVGSKGLTALSQALECGYAPRLRILNLEGCQSGGGIGSLAGPMTKAYFNHMEELTLSHNRTTVNDFAVFAQALIDGWCKRLRRLLLNDVDIEVEGARLLAMAFASRSLPQLEDLQLYWNIKTRDEGVMALMEGMKVEGAACGLRALNVSGIILDVVGCSALCSALRQGALPALEELRLGECVMFSCNPLQLLAQAFSAGGGQQLKGLFVKVRQKTGRLIFAS